MASVVEPEGLGPAKDGGRRGFHGNSTDSLLFLPSGKKSPVSGKWKEFFFILKYDEQKLLYYEHENVSGNRCVCMAIPVRKRVF